MEVNSEIEIMYSQLNIKDKLCYLGHVLLDDVSVLLCLIVSINMNSVLCIVSSVLLLLCSPCSGQDAPVPVVLWHGMGDSAAGMIGIAVRKGLIIITSSLIFS